MHSTGTLCVITDASSRSMDEMKAWHYADKGEMKHLGGTLIQMADKLREFLILGISKMVQDAFNDIKEIRGINLSPWYSSLNDLEHVRDVRWLRHLSNVIKHNRSFISSRCADQAGKRTSLQLINHFGAPDDTPVGYLPEFVLRPFRDTMLRHIYYGMTFCFDLLDHAELFPRRHSTIVDEEIPGHMLDQFVRDLPGHPQRTTNR